MSKCVYVVRDASGEYLAAKGGRTPASDEAGEYESRQEAEAACTRATDRVLSREVEPLVTCCVCGVDVSQEAARIVATDHGPDSVCDDCEYVADQEG